MTLSGPNKDPSSSRIALRHMSGYTLKHKLQKTWFNKVHHLIHQCLIYVSTDYKTSFALT